jgi:hypothetical protein
MVRKRKWLLLVVLVSGMGAVFWRPRWQLAQYKAELESKGVRLSVKEMEPRAPASEENAGPRLATLTEQLRFGKLLPNEFIVPMRLAAPGHARVAWRQPQPLDRHSPGSTLTNFSWHEASAILDEDQAILTEIKEILARPRLDMRLDYSKGFQLLLPHLARNKSLAQLLSRAVMAGLHAGDSTAAFDNLHALLCLTRLAGEEPLLISQLVQTSITHIAWATAWEALQAPGWSDAQLAQMQRDWEVLEFVQPMKRALGMERAMSIRQFETFRHSFQELRRDAFGSSDVSVPETIGRALKCALWQWYFSYPDELHYLQFSGAVIDGYDEIQKGTPMREAQIRLDASLKRLYKSKSQAQGANDGDDHSRGGLGYWITSLTGNFSNIPSKTAQIEAARGLVIAAIALERLRRGSGGAPPDLSALVPAYLKTVPADPIDGKPLRCKPGGGKTWLLYSVGEDGVDDGGDGRPPNDDAKEFRLFQGRDWVWPSAATPEEIEASEARLAKKRN